MRVLAARDADQHGVAMFDHVVVGDGLACLALQAFGETLQVVRIFHEYLLIDFGDG